MRTLPLLVILLAACSGAGGEERPKSAAPAAPGDSAAVAATADGKPANKPQDGQAAPAGTAEGFGTPPSQASGAQPAAQPADDDLPEIRRLDPSEIEAERQGTTQEIQPLRQGKP
jgi:hypothetical protein